VYTLFRKTLFAIITTLLDGRINAICSLVLQSVDTALLILYRPLCNKEGLFLEISGGITNLLAFVNICAPIIFGELAAWPSWMDDTFTVMTGLFATVLGAVFSVVGAISSLVAPLCALKNVLWSYCLFPSCCRVFLPSCCQGALVEEILDMAPDSDEILVVAKLNIAGEIDGQLADRAMNYEAFADESNNEAMIGVLPSVVGGGVAAAGVGAAAHQYAAGAGAAAHQFYNLQYKLHAIITMSLDIDYKSIGEEGSIDRVFFNNDLKRDLSRASARLPPECFEIRKLSKLSPGSVLAEIAIVTQSNHPSTMAAIFCCNLLQQYDDPASVIRTGKVTRAITSIVIQDSSGKFSPQPQQKERSNKEDKSEQKGRFKQQEQHQHCNQLHNLKEQHQSQQRRHQDLQKCAYATIVLRPNLIAGMSSRERAVFEHDLQMDFSRASRFSMLDGSENRTKGLPPSNFGIVQIRSSDMWEMQVDLEIYSAIADSGSFVECLDPRKHLSRHGGNGSRDMEVMVPRHSLPTNFSPPALSHSIEVASKHPNRDNAQDSSGDVQDNAQMICDRMTEKVRGNALSASLVWGDTNEIKIMPTARPRIFTAAPSSQYIPLPCDIPHDTMVSQKMSDESLVEFLEGAQNGVVLEAPFPATRLANVSGDLTEILNNLKDQSCDPSSPLSSGIVTKFVTGFRVKDFFIVDF
jgi:hypothetical protein